MNFWKHYKMKNWTSYEEAHYPSDINSYFIREEYNESSGESYFRVWFKYENKEYPIAWQNSLYGDKYDKVLKDFTKWYNYKFGKRIIKDHKIY